MARASVLVIDDEAGVRDMLAHELSREGFEVETAANGMLAIDAMKRRKFDLAITDLKMSGMDGVQTLETLRRIDPDIEVIVATGYATIETAVACMKRGAYDYIQKPYELGKLTSLLERAMQKSHLQGVVTLYEASRVLLETLEHDKLPGLVVDLAGQVFEGDVIGLVVDDSGKYTAPDQPTIAPALLDKLTSMTDDAAVRLPDAMQDLPRTAKDAGFCAALVLPLTSRKHSLGSLVVLRSQGRPVFSESESRRGTILAGQVALCLDNARLYRELGERVNDLVDTRQQLVQAEKFHIAARLASFVAHEINNPLTYIQANLDELRDYATSVGGLQHSEVPALTDEILEGVNRISELVAGFNRMSQPVDFKGAEEIDLTELIDDCLRTTCKAESSQAIDVEVVGAPLAWASTEDVRTAVLNVMSFLTTRISNQRRSFPFRIRCAAESERSVITIEASELPLSEEERLRILDPRVQVDARQGRAMRLDIQMSLAYHLLVRNGGNLRVDAHAEGTAFRIELPRKGA